MYNENTNFSLKNVIIQFLFLALLVFILIWLFPLKSDLNNLNNGDNNNDGINVLVDRIFNENIIAMKDAAKSYYTTPRLPQNVGDKVKMTLGEMLDKKIILPFTDKNGDSCSLTDSYVEITKNDDEFVMKVNLKCGKEENYLLVYMGCYDYCSTAICEKNKQDMKAPVIYSSKTQQPVKENTTSNSNTNNNVINNVINNIINIVNPTKPDTKYYCSVVNGKFYDTKGNVVSEADYKKSCEQQEQKYYCSIVNGKFYDAKGNVVSEADYKKSCEQQEEEKYYCSVVNGKFYDAKGNVVSEAAYKKSCNLEEKYYCSIVNGKYYDINGNVVSEATYKKSCGIEEKYYCKLVNGKYYDANGNVVDQAAYKKSCEKQPNPQPKVLYEYKKTTAGTCTETAWSDWSTTPVTASSTVAVKTKTVTEKKLVGYNVTKATDYSKPIYGTKQTVVGKETKDVCTKYDYVATGQYSYSDWQDVGIVYLNSSPNNTNTERYVKVGEDNWVCKENCTAGATYAYRKYVRQTVPVTKYQCTKWEKQTKDIVATVKVITGYEQKVVSKTPVYKETTKKLYSYKTRTCTSASVDVKWSTYNDKSLLNAGYVYTGRTKNA